MQVMKISLTSVSGGWCPAVKRFFKMDELCPPLLLTKCAAKLKQRAGCLQVWERRYKILGIINTTSMSTCIKNLYSVCHSELQLHANVLERVIVFLPVEHRRQILHPHCSSIDVHYCKK